MEEIEVDLEQGSAWKIEEFGPEQDRKEEAQKDDSLMSFMRKRLEALPESGEQRYAIFRVPESIRKSTPHLFEPGVVSIGPFHRGKKHLHAIEEMKWPLLREFFAEAKNISLESCITEMRALEAEARKCYNETIHMDSDAFVQMMLLDASFIIQFLFSGSGGHALFKNICWNAIIIRNDLILIENQIPFFILEKMCFYLYGETFSSKDFINIVRRIGSAEFMSTNTSTPPEKIYHLLHLCHHYIVPNNEFDLETPINYRDKTRKHSQFCPSWIAHRPKELIKTCLNLGKKHVVDPSLSVGSLPCATQLKEAGVKIKKKEPPSHFTNITFQSGVLEIPALCIMDSTPVILMNLIALEQGLSERTKVITTYCLFMDAIVNTADDVMILERKGIIDNMFASEEAVALFLNQSCQHVEIELFHYLRELFMNVNKYCNKKSHRNRAKLMRDYFSNPWSMLSLGAAIFLLLLTCTQTIFSVFAYFLPP